MGENGAGKSTIIKVLTGVYPRDGGEILFEGRPFAAGSPHKAQEQGISTVYQEVNLVPNLSVAENLLLGRQPTRGGLIDGREMKRRAEAILKRLNLHVDVNQLLVEDQDLGLELQRAADGHHLLHRDGVVAEQLVDVDVQVEPLQDGLGAALHLAAVDEATARRLAPQ